ncbi:MAG: ClpXP protease specificity-enhancing factor, partial [Gammaproteobacteria bacterium]|nr:ClpXP protease specificity-enhancing factor [Gammaproteobacteria bacterium]
AGVAHEVYAPIGAVMGVIAKENGEGMWFPREESESEPEPKPPSDFPPAKPKGPPSLKVVK